MVTSKSVVSSTQMTAGPSLPVAASRFDIESGIREVLGGKGLTVQFQPIFDLGAWLVGTKRAVGFEALARFDLPVAPDIWFREATRMGLGTELELTAIHTAVAHLPQIPANAFLSVNISPETVLQLPDLDWFQRLPLRRVVIEISEQATIDDYETFRRVLDGLRVKGLKVAVDDVGAGLASLKHLVMLPHDILKLDLDVVRGVDADHNCQAMVAALLALAQARHTQLIAEAIETSDELVTLVDLGVAYGQGYHLAHPGPLPQPPKRMSDSPIPRRMGRTTQRTDKPASAKTDGRVSTHEVADRILNNLTGPRHRTLLPDTGTRCSNPDRQTDTCLDGGYNPHATPTS